MVLCIVGSTAAPQMIRAFGLIAFWTTSDAFCASLTVISGPPVTLISAPVAPAISTCNSGELIASRTASSARFSLSDSPIPIRATPPPFMIVRRSLKSRLTSPGRVMISVIPRIARASTESATLNAVWIGSRGTSSRSRSFGIVMTVSIDRAQPLEPPRSVLLADQPFGGERERADGDRERSRSARVLRALRDDRGGARPGAATEPERDEHHVGVRERLLELVLGLASPPARRPAAGRPRRDPASVAGRGGSSAAHGS